MVAIRINPQIRRLRQVPGGVYSGRPRRNQSQLVACSATLGRVLHNKLSLQGQACFQDWAASKIARLVADCSATPQLPPHNSSQAVFSPALLAPTIPQLNRTILEGFSGTRHRVPRVKPSRNPRSVLGLRLRPIVSCKNSLEPAVCVMRWLILVSGTNPGAGQQQQQQQQQQAQKPTLSLFGTQNTTTQQPTQQTPAAGSNTVIQGVKVDITNLLPTTKYESCADEVKAELERFDTFIVNQINMCNEVASILPLVASQGSTIPNDVEYVQGKLETMQHALENDASDIDQLRSLVSRDAAEAQVAFRAIDTLKLPLQYQSTGGSGWWSAQDQKVSDSQSLRSTRKSTLALPDDVEGEPSMSTINGVPVNLVEYFSQRSDEMGVVLERYTRNLKEIEDHLHGVESTLERQIHEFTTSRNRDSAGNGAPKTVLNDLAAVLADVETGILGVASRLGAVTEQAQEVVLGAPSGLRQA